MKTLYFSWDYFLVEKRTKFSPDVNTFAQVFQYQYQYQYFHSSIFNTNTNTNTLIFRISIPIPIPIPKSIAIPIPIPIVLHTPARLAFRDMAFAKWANKGRFTNKSEQKQLWKECCKLKIFLHAYQYFKKWKKVQIIFFFEKSSKFWVLFQKISKFWATNFFTIYEHHYFTSIE